MERVVIVGGGIAGLTCLNLLLDKGISPLLLEGGSVGSPKMCGEFLAPPAVSFLERWNIGPIQTIEQVNFFANQKKVTVKFPKFAGAFARDEAELQLAYRAKQIGGIIRENSPILNILPDTTNSSYILHLKSGENIHAASLILCTGRFNVTECSVNLPYYGLKTHIPNVIEPKTLLMQSLQHAYFGIVPISEHTSNFACLVKKEAVEKAGSNQQFFYDLSKRSTFLQHALKNIDLNNISLLEGKSPEFSLKNNPNWPNVYWIGDALASLPPAIGYGFVHSIQSAVTAVEYFMQNNSTKYYEMSQSTIKPKLAFGKLMHKLLLAPFLASLALPFIRINSWLPKLLLERIGYNK